MSRILDLFRTLLETFSNSGNKLPIATSGLATQATVETLASEAAVPTILRPAFVMGAFLASTALMPQVTQDLIDGEFVVPQGSALIVHGVAAAGTSPLVMVGLTWEEVPA